MANKFTTSTNIVRDTNRDLNYIPTLNTILIAEQINKDFKQGLRSYNLIGSYGTGKSSFLWAMEQSIKGTRSYFGVDLVKNAKVGFIKIVGSFQSLKEVLADDLGVRVKKNLSENIFSELYNQYYDLGKKNSLLVIEIDEFGKFLEFAAHNNPEEELYFIQQLAEFVNNPDYNILLITTMHQNFDAYSIGLSISQRQEWTKVKGRFKEITFNEPIEQLLYLAAEHIGEQDYRGDNKSEVDKIVKLLISSKIFNVKLEYIKEIAKKIYPLDIFSAYIITSALQKYGQNERSLFTFLESTDHTSLYQHKILNKGIYSVADIYDYLIYNFFSSINSRYNPDFSTWKTIKSSLERVEATFDQHIIEYSKIVKTIGLLSLNAQAGAILDNKFLINYAELSLGVKNSSFLITSLERKKIIQFRNYSNRYILADGTDLDIEIALIEAAKKIDEVRDVVTLLKKNYHLAPVLAKRAMFETGTPRLFEYIISSEPIVIKPLGEIDGFVNLIFCEDDIQSEIVTVSRDCEHAILYCYYKNSKEIRELLFEIEKTQKVIEENSDDRVAIKELQNIIVHQRNLLNHRIINSLFSEKSPVVWIFNGELKNLTTQRAFNQFLSEICQTVYNQTPYFNNELVNKHKISTSIHTAKKNYYKALTNEWDVPQLGFPIDKFPPEKTIYLSLLENNGLRLCNDDLASVIEPHNKNGFRNLWEASVEFLNTAKVSKRNILEFSDILSNKPFKLKQGFVDFWIPTFLFIKRDEFALFNEGIYTPIISEEILELVAKVPQDFEVKSFALEGVKLDIFNSYRKFLNIDSRRKANTQTFIETIKPFLVFYRGLPEYSKETQRISKASLAIRTAIANSKDPEQSFFEDFPAALGYSVSKIQKNRAELQHFIIELQDSIKEIRNSFDELVNRFETFILDTYFDTPIAFEEYQKSFQQRYKKLHRHLLLTQQKSFVQRIDSRIEDKKAWLNSLVQSLVGKSLDKFRDEDELVLYHKFVDMILSLDSLNEISKVKFDEEKEIVFNVQINSFVDGMTKKIIRLPKIKSKKVISLEAQIRKLLSTDKNIDLAALTSVLKDLM